jgi:hypothetical protein
VIGKLRGCHLGSIGIEGDGFCYHSDPRGRAELRRWFGAANFTRQEFHSYIFKREPTLIRDANKPAKVKLLTLGIEPGDIVRLPKKAVRQVA